MNTNETLKPPQVGGSALNDGLYRTLSFGEIIQEGDEGLTKPEMEWIKLIPAGQCGWAIGMPVCAMVPDIRRRI